MATLQQARILTHINGTNALYIRYGYERWMHGYIKRGLLYVACTGHGIKLNTL